MSTLLDIAIKNSIIMALVIGMCHLLIKNTIEDTNRMEKFVSSDHLHHNPASSLVSEDLKQRKQQELLKFIMESSLSPSSTEDPVLSNVDELNPIVDSFGEVGSIGAINRVNHVSNKNSETSKSQNHIQNDILPFNEFAAFGSSFSNFSEVNFSS